MKEQQGLPVTLPSQVTICSKPLPSLAQWDHPFTSAASSQELSPCLTSPATHWVLAASTITRQELSLQQAHSVHDYCEHVYYYSLYYTQAAYPQSCTFLHKYYILFILFYIWSYQMEFQEHLTPLFPLCLGATAHWSFSTTNQSCTVSLSLSTQAFVSSVNNLNASVDHVVLAKSINVLFTPKLKTEIFVCFILPTL